MARTIAGALAVLVLATMASAANFSVQLESATVVPGPSAGTLDVFVTADADAELTGLDLDIDITPTPGLTLTGLSSVHPGFDLISSLDTSGAGTGEYSLSAASFASFVPLTADAPTMVLSLDYSLADVSECTFDLAPVVTGLSDDFVEVTPAASAPGATFTVLPEPAALSLVSLAGAGLLRRRR
jgi:MYXO-CTERM domain-containing protein